MKWYEYKAEVDHLHASEELKARLLAMQTAQAPAPAAPARKKAVYFPLKRVLGIAACFGVGFLCCGAIGFSTLGIGMRAGSANSTAAVMSARNAVPQMASYQMDMENAMPEIAADRALEPQARTGGQEAAQAGARYDLHRPPHPGKQGLRRRPGTAGPGPGNRWRLSGIQRGICRLRAGGAALPVLDPAGAAGKLRELFAGCGTDRQPGEPKPAGRGHHHTVHAIWKPAWPTCRPSGSACCSCKPRPIRWLTCWRSNPA